MKILVAEQGQHVIEACRHLSRNGHTIIMATNSQKQSRIMKLFRHIDKSILLENKKGIEKIVELNSIFMNENCDVFYPFGFKLVTDYYTALKQNPKLKMNSPYGRDNNYWALSDKSYLYETLKDTNIALPVNYGCISKNDSISIKSYPVIVKRTRGVGINGNIILAWDKKDIESFIAKNSKDEFLIQQYIPGDVYDVGGFSINGEVYYAVPQRRTVTLPLRGGVAAVNDVYDDPDLIDQAKMIMKKSHWTGPFQVEFRQDPSTKKYYLIEVNAKMWGSSPLSLKANTHLLDIALDVALGKKPSKSLEYKNELRYRWLFGQELQAMAYGNRQDFKKFISRFLKPSCYDIDITDPIPDLARLLFTLYLISFGRKKLVKPLIDAQTHKKLN